MFGFLKSLEVGWSKEEVLPSLKIMASENKLSLIKMGEFDLMYFSVTIIKINSYTLETNTRIMV